MPHHFMGLTKGFQVLCKSKYTETNQDVIIKKRKQPKIIKCIFRYNDIYSNILQIYNVYQHTPIACMDPHIHLLALASGFLGFWVSRRMGNTNYSWCLTFLWGDFSIVFLYLLKLHVIREPNKIDLLVILNIIVIKHYISKEYL